MKSYSGAMQLEIYEGHVTPILFVKVELAARTDYYCSAGVDVDWNGESWMGVNGVIGLSTVDEGEELKSRVLTFSIPGLSQSQTSDFFNTKIQGRPITMWFGLIGESGIIADPAVEFAGALDTPNRKISGTGEVQISMSAGSKMARWSRASNSRYTDEEQRNKYPGDTYFQFVAAMAESVSLVWPGREFRG